MPSDARQWLPAAALALVLVVLVAIWSPWSGDEPERSAGGVTVAGVDVGDKTRGDVFDALRTLPAPKPREITVRGQDGERFPMVSTGAGVRPDLAATADRVMGAAGDQRVAPAMVADDRKVGAFVKATGDKLDHRAKDADIDPRDGKLKVVDEQDGFRVDRQGLKRKVTAALTTIGGAATVTAAPGETLKPERTKANLAEKIPRYLVVDRSKNELRVYDRLELHKKYDISVGKAGNDTPPGKYEVTARDVDPAWHAPDAAWAGDLAGQTIPPGDPRNPLKARWLGLDDGVGIHGTAEEESIGSEASHGCIRMKVEDVKQLFRGTPMKTPVYVS